MIVEGDNVVETPFLDGKLFRLIILCFTNARTMSLGKRKNRML